MAWDETERTAWRTRRDAWRAMTGWCIAYCEDGRVRREPAHIVDPQRGGLVRAAHVPVVVAEPGTIQEV
jgi:hypothetical protein